jgi:hypothetical protein
MGSSSSGGGDVLEHWEPNQGVRRGPEETDEGGGRAH